MIVNPSLLEKRINLRETEKEQKTVVLYSGIMFREDVKVFYYTYKIIGILSEPFDSFINEIIKVYCEDFCSENDADIIKEFISSHKSIYIKVKQELLMGVK